MEKNETLGSIRKEIAEFLIGGFAPVVILLREFHYEKASVVLEGLPFSAWSLLEHMRTRQSGMLSFIKNPENKTNLWPKAYWPENPIPPDKNSWERSIKEFEKDLSEIIQIIQSPDIPLFEMQQNGKSIFWAAQATLHHNAYHMGQIKAIGRQLGVW